MSANWKSFFSTKIFKWGILFIIWAGLMMSFESTEPTIPPYENLKVIEGKFQQLGRATGKTYSVVYRVGAQNFACNMDYWGGSNGCSDDKDIRKLVGNYAKARWYVQSARLGPINILMELEINGKQLFSYEQRKANLLSAYYNSSSGIKFIRIVFTFAILMIGFIITRK